MGYTKGPELLEEGHCRKGNEFKERDLEGMLRDDGCFLRGLDSM